MHFRTCCGWVGVVAVVTAMGSPALAQSEPRPRKSFSALINVEALTDNYLRFLARKYDLNEQQAAFTDQLVRQKLDDFLGRHHADLADLIDRLVEVRAGGEMSQAELIAWGRRVQPIYQEAKAIIAQGNTEWREVLNDKQKAIHDEDLKQMWESFATTDSQLERMIRGQMTVEEFRTNPQQPPPQRPVATPAQPPARPPQPVASPTQAAAPTAPGAQPTPGAVSPAPAAAPTPTPKPTPAPTVVVQPGASPQPGTAPQPGMSPQPSVSPQPGAGAGRAAGRTPQPSAGAAGVPNPAVARPVVPGVSPGAAANESEWEAYVRQFIQRYQLTEEQQQRAWKILEQCQQRAERYRQARQADLQRLDKRLADLQTSGNPDALKELNEINAARAKLLEPIQMIFERNLKPRLDKLPTRAQREAATKSGPTGQPGAAGAAAAGRPGAQPTPRPNPPPPRSPGGGK